MEETIYTLSNCEVMRLDVDDDKQLYVGVTTVLDVAAPFPEGLRMYLRVTSFEESRDRLESTGSRGTGLHEALDRLAKAEEIDLREYKTTYEKDAIVTFIQMWRFLNPGKFDTELIVADPTLRMAGTMDFNGFVEDWRLTALLDPTRYLEVDSDGELQLKEKWFNLPENSKRIRIVIDWKFTGRNAFSHKLQVAEYKTMNNKSRPGRQCSRAFTWRYSPKHKFRFDFQESELTHRDFMQVYKTFITYTGKFPQPPQIRRYPTHVRLYDKVENDETATN